MLLGKKQKLFGQETNWKYFAWHGTSPLHSAL
jgi:hypothetical protein